MLKRTFMVAAVVLGASTPLAAQLTSPVKNGDTTIVVTGTRDGAKKVEMSDWRMAETPHVVVFGKGDEKELVRTAHNLEKLHFLLSVLLNRIDQPDDTIKIAVTMIGDAADFNQLRLTDARWQFGPFPAAFPSNIYYDPRAEGPVLASSASDVKIILQPSRTQPTHPNCDVAGPGSPTTATHIETSPPKNGSAGDATLPDLGGFNVGEVSFCQSSGSRIYAGFAQNYLMTYFPAAYPRWYLQGFGEMFATIAAKNSEIEYGQRPDGFREVLEHFGNYPVDRVLSGKYLTDKRWKPDWTPYHAWRLVHFLFFSEEWRKPFHDYLAAVASGKSEAEATRLLGDVGKLRRQLAEYSGRKVPFERMSFPAERAPAPVVRQLTRAEAGLVRGRLELGARTTIPDHAPAARAAALKRRDAWLGRLRDNAARFPDRVENHLLLAEAECRSGNGAKCLQSADRSLAMVPGDTSALVWKGLALAQMAATAPPAERSGRMREARSWIARANRADPGAVVPLIAYYDTFKLAGEPAPDTAVDGLFKAVESSPAAPAPRVQLGGELVRRGLDAEARRTLLPVARGAFESPERGQAEQLLQQGPGSTSQR